ncbi:hypothetical protein OMAG_001521 [Candidatus Omnitrophus magneticus]|uniref:Uncharacterized protein n=1 Tax=Candidatus Omnitrophus magneticus TaxID=1609969 RepID=A0A0F0CSV4_9BACT|nr:hypothetical protein OMAG_001521 [Candidatus Omnitrophus magneticus]
MLRDLAGFQELRNAKSMRLSKRLFIQLLLMRLIGVHEQWPKLKD